MENYQKQLNKVAEVASRIRIRVEEEIDQSVHIELEYSSNFITLKFMEKDNCSYSKLTLAYETIKENHLQKLITEVYVDKFLEKFYAEDFEIYEASAEEIFINNLIRSNDCENLHTLTGEIGYFGNYFPLMDATKIAYYPELNEVRIDTDLEYCILDFDDDLMESFDKECD